MDLFSNLQLLHEAAISVLVTTTYSRWRTITHASLTVGSTHKRGIKGSVETALGMWNLRY